MTIIHRKKKIRRVLMFSAIVLSIMILGIGLYASYLVYKANNVIHQMVAPENPLMNGRDVSANTSMDPEINDAIKPLIFLLAGIDSRDGSGGVINTDVLMLVSFNPQTRSASMLSLPRDLLIKPKTMSSRKANYYYAHYYIKDKTTAIPNTKQLFSEVLNLPINHMVVVDFNALRSIVDALGGLEIDVEMDMKYTDTADGTQIDLKKGLQSLDGQKVLDYVRYRKSNHGTQESSDFARSERQQLVIKQIIEKLGTFQGITQWGKILDIFGENMTMDVSENDIRQWILSFSKMKPNQIQSLQFEAEWKSPYVYANAEELHEALNALRAEVGLDLDNLSGLDDMIGIIK